MPDQMKHWTEKGVKVAVISGDNRDKAGNQIFFQIEVEAHLITMYSIIYGVDTDRHTYKQTDGHRDTQPTYTETGTYTDR